MQRFSGHRARHRLASPPCPHGIATAMATLAALLAGNVGATAQDLSQPGPFAGGWRTVTVTRPNSTTFNARLHYPATGAGGQNAAFDPTGGPYPAISFGHGFLQPVTQYQSTCQHLATHGYFVIASESEGGLFPSHANFAADLRHCLTWLEQQNANPASLYFQAIETQAFGLSGHSMGGGASILAAAADPRVRVVANLAAAETNPSAIAAMANVSVPVVLISGTQDSITPISTNTQPMYSAGAAPKQLPAILGGFHCGFTDGSFIGCDSGGISRSQQLAITRRLLTQSFDLYLKGDPTHWRSVWGPERDLATDVTTSAASGILVGPLDLTIAACPGSVATAPLTVTNTGSFSTSYSLSAEDSSWPVTITPAQTATLPPGASATFAVSIDTPPGVLAAQTTALVSARSDRDGGTRGWTRVTFQRPAGRGDLNCDGVVSFDDIDAFVIALSGEAAYAAAYPDCQWLRADCDCDGAVTFDDIDPFVRQIGQ
ncbi:MAG: dienelactone hydrolase family protein [Phycisphaerales bacterium]|nr:dienelactone hydrolase family protein [Phycisphaerales bacterium]